MTNIKEKGFDCTIKNNIQVVETGVKKLISEILGIENSIALESLQNQDYVFFMKLVEWFKESDTDIYCFSESELWCLVENIQNMEKVDIEMSLDKLELSGLLKYEYHEEENEELCYVVWVQGIDNCDQFIKTTEN